MDASLTYNLAEDTKLKKLLNLAYNNVASYIQVSNMVCSIIDGSRIESQIKFSRLKIAPKTPVHSRITKLDLIQLLRVNERRVSLQLQ
jgi:hypothetical protein